MPLGDRDRMPPNARKRLDDMVDGRLGQQPSSSCGPTGCRCIRVRPCGPRPQSAIAERRSGLRSRLPRRRLAPRTLPRCRRVPGAEGIGDASIITSVGARLPRCVHRGRVKSATERMGMGSVGDDDVTTLGYGDLSPAHNGGADHRDGGDGGPHRLRRVADRSVHSAVHRSRARSRAGGWGRNSNAWLSSCSDQQSA
jgi:hypothetical protein